MQFKQKLQRYQDVFTRAAEQRYPLTERDEKRFKQLQQVMSLRDEDVPPIREKMLEK